MKKVTQKTQAFISRIASLGGHVFVLIAAFLLLAGGFYVAQAQSGSGSGSGSSSSDYHSPEAIEYCKSITPDFKNLACQDGWDGKVQDCNDYAGFTKDLGDPTLVVDDVVAACANAKEDKDTCTKLANKETTTKTPHRTCPKIASTNNSTDDAATVEDLTKQIQQKCQSLKDSGKLDKLDDTSAVKKTCENKGSSDSSSSDNSSSSSTQDQIDELKKEVENLKKASETSLPDNQYGQYVNGANQYQAIRVNRASGDNNAALILFHGGGWTSDDGAADKFAPKANERGYTTFVATYRLGTSGIYYQLDDVMRAIQHVRNNAGMYGIDPNRIGVWGDSAGGSLAVRAASTAKTGAKAQAGWSTPTNAYTAIFHSARAFGAGMLHSTCAPTSISSVNDIVKQLNGEDSSSSSSSSSSSGTSNDATDALTLANQAVELSENVEKLSNKIDSSDTSELSGNVRRLATKKLIECIDNFNTASPALFARPGSPPGFFAGYDNDPLVHPGQAFQMRDKLRAIGTPSEVLILHGAESDATESALGLEKNGENHLGYNEKFVGPTLDFFDTYLTPQNHDSSATGGTQQAAASPTPAPSASTASASQSGSSGNNSSSGGNNSSDNSNPCNTPVANGHLESVTYTWQGKETQGCTVKCNSGYTPDYEAGTCSKTDGAQQCRDRGGDRYNSETDLCTARRASKSYTKAQCDLMKGTVTADEGCVYYVLM